VIIAGGNRTIDLEVTDHALDAFSLPAEAFVVADCHLAVGFGWDDGLDAALLEMSADGIGNLRDFCPTRSIDPGRVDRQVPSSVIFPEGGAGVRTQARD
jgi:hypothetical protein